jgi:sugar phosphate isomerase/epimerase
MYLTGFADEAAADVEGQIRATRELGWCHIEARNIGGTMIHDLPEAAFEEAAAKLDAAGVRVNCFGSAIANWGKSIEQPFDVTLAEVRRAIPRMQRLGTRLIRIMSFAIRKGVGPEDQMAEERFRRLREVVRMFRDAGLEPVHENCNNYGGMGWPFTLRLIENVPGLKLCFDTGNPVFSDDRARPAPCAKQSAWEFYEHVRDYVAYIHIKDGAWNALEQKMVFSMPGDGQGDVRRIVRDMLARGYDGGISIEPHLAVVFHDAAVRSEARVRFDNYVEYGRRMVRMLDEIRAEPALAPRA